MSSTWAWALGILGTLALIVGIVAYDAQQQNRATSVPEEVAVVGDDEWVLGPSDAKVTIIEYADFQCPACRYAAPAVKQVQAEFPDQVRLVYRHFPLKSIHDNAEPAARATEAAGKQGKFWEMAALLYEEQAAWQASTDIQADLLAYAAQLQLNTDQFTTDFASEAVAAQVDADVRSGQRAQIDATPTFIVNGKRVKNPGAPENWRALIEAELQGAE